MEYAQYLNAQPGGVDVFNFRVIDHSTALRWNPDGSTFTRQGGIWDGESPTDQLTHFQFTINLVRLANNPTPDQVLHGVFPPPLIALITLALISTTRHFHRIVRSMKVVR